MFTYNEVLFLLQNLYQDYLKTICKSFFYRFSLFYHRYTSIPFTSNIHTSRSCRISLESSSFIRLVPLQKSYLREMQRCQDWISPLRVHRRMSMGSGLDGILRRVVMWMDCIVMGVNRRCGGKDHRRLPKQPFQPLACALFFSSAFPLPAP